MVSVKYALVTGGNRGIGLEVCKQLVAKGKPVLLTCRNAAQGKSAADSLLATTPTAVVKCLDLDTADSSSIQQLAAVIKQEYDQQIDLLVNNAGILITKVWDQETYDKTVTVNTKGPIAVSRALLPYLAPNALIIMVSSGLGSLGNLTPDYEQAIQSATSLDTLQAIPFKQDSKMGTAAPASGSWTPTYSIAKALLNKAVQLIAQEEGFKAKGIRVASTCPGWCKTDMGGAGADRTAEQGGSSVLWPYWNWTSSLQASFTRDGEVKPW